VYVCVIILIFYLLTFLSLRKCKILVYTRIKYNMLMPVASGEIRKWLRMVHLSIITVIFHSRQWNCRQSVCCLQICTDCRTTTLTIYRADFNSARTNDDRSFRAHDKFPSSDRRLSVIKKKSWDLLGTLIRVSVDSNGAACRQLARYIHDISIRKRRKRFIAIFFFFFASFFNSS